MDKFLLGLLGFYVLNNCINKLLGHYVTIYMIHRPEPKDGIHHGLSPALLEQCLIYAKKQNYHFASLDEIVSDAIQGRVPSRPTLCFTIDDGFDDQVEELVPILLKYEAKPTIFVLTNFVDGVDWPWDSKIGYMVNNTSCCSDYLSYKGVQFPLNFDSMENKILTRRALVKYAKYLPSQELDDFMKIVANELAVSPPLTAPTPYKPTSWERLCHYESLGLKVGSHACTHRVFSSLALDTVKEEIIHAKNRLEMELSLPSRVFCFPSGTAKDFSTVHSNLVRELGYMGAVSANPGNNTMTSIKQTLYTITRHTFPNTLAQFARYSSWFEVIRSKLT
ncbi:MAG: polysaccharide deacetylase family protein [Pseudomonadota bacterium]